MMGMINIVTRLDVNEASVSYGSFNRRQAYGLVSQKIGKVKVNIFAHMETDDGDDYRVQDTFSSSRIDTDDPYKLANLNVKLQWRNTQINLQHSQFQLENFYELGWLSNDVNSRDGQLSSISLQQGFDWQSVTTWLWLSYNRSGFASTGQATAPGDLAAISNPTSNDAFFFITEFGDYTETRAQLHNNWTINAQSGLQFGIELRHIDAPEIISETNFDLADLSDGNIPIRYYGTLRANTSVQARSSRDIAGLYTQYQHQLFETSHLILGLRYDDFSNIGSQFSPRLGLVHDLNNHHSLKLLYGEAFRAPSEIELNLQNNILLLGNADLQPETVQSWDLIWVGQWPHAGISLGYFENRFKDSIVPADIGGGVLQFQNVDQDPTKGIEFELSYEFDRRWLLRASYTRISEKPDLSFRKTEQLASVVLNYQQGMWDASLITIWHDEREMATGNSESNRITLNDYWQVYGKFRYTFTTDFQGIVQIKNLLDKDYQTPHSNASLTEGVPNRGREILAGIIWQF